jgi:hypothetical protein
VHTGQGLRNVDGATEMTSAKHWPTCVRVPIAAAVVAAAMTLSALTAHATSAVFTVANYPVDAKAQDAVAAKAAALADGQQAALRSLFRRLVPVTAYRRLKAMPPASAADLIDGVSIKDERNSQTQYLATLDFAFQADGVRNVLRKNGIPFVDTQGPQTVVIPIYRAKPDAAFTSGTGVWFDAWTSLDLAHTLTPVKLEKLKVEITPDTIKAAMAGTGTVDRILAAEYKTDRVVLAIAEPDAAGKHLVVTLTGIDAVGSFSFKRNYRIQRGDTAYVAELGAVVGLGVMEGRWKAAKAGAVGGIDVTDGSDAIKLQVEFGSLNEWNDIRTRILETDGAQDVEIGSVSGRLADVGLRYPGGASQLASALATQGLTMRQSGGTWVVQSRF